MAQTKEPAWLTVARGEIGQHEKKGGENPRILEYHATTTLHAREDEVPWCSAFVNWCIEKSGLVGTKSAAAKSWTEWGEQLKQPVVGAVTVIKQKSSGADAATGSTSGFHVAFYLGTENGRVRLLGGNQSDSVKESTFGLGSYEVVGYFWPDGVPA